MALFGKKSIADFTTEELQAELDKRKQSEKPAEAPKEDMPKAETPMAESPKAESPAEEKPAEMKADAPVEATEEVPKAEEKPAEEQPEAPEEEVKAEEKSDANAEIVKAMQAQLETALEEIRVYKAKVDELLEKVGQADKPAESVGLEKAKKAESEPNDDDLSAGEYAKKYAKY